MGFVYSVVDEWVRGEMVYSVVRMGRNGSPNDVFGVVHELGII